MPSYCPSHTSPCPPLPSCFCFWKRLFCTCPNPNPAINVRQTTRSQSKTKPLCCEQKTPSMSPRQHRHPAASHATRQHSNELRGSERRKRG
eukprot:1874318-Rhodomonas_salina.1